MDVTRATHPRIRWPWLLAGFALFVLLGTLNSAGYRYGASDQAYYGPAVIARLHPDYYPRDRALLDSQSRLTLADESVAALARATGAPLTVLFAALYAASLVLLASAAVQFGRLYFRTAWATAALAAALTLRHAIAQTGTNTLEGYFHPRQVAFGCGAWALVLFLRGRQAWALLPLAAAMCFHPTAALWFVLWIAAAAMVTVWSAVRARPVALAAGLVAAGILACVLLTVGPLAGRLHVMDAEWLATLTDKTYLFPLSWPWPIWLVNLSYPALIAWLHARRRAAGLATPGETAVALGSLALFAVFLLSLPFGAARVQLAIQLQPARIFWMLDLLATIYVVWGLAEGIGAGETRARLVAGTVCLLSIARGVYIATIEFPDRPVFAIGLPDSDWGRVMAWARRSSPPASQWLADPSHASLYGTSVRIAGERDVVVEASKDRAVGMYDRRVAMRTRDRVAAIGDFPSLSAERVRTLADRYGVDFLVTEAVLPFPEAFTSGRLHVYRVR